MSYSKHIFKSGEKLYATQLNEMEEQIAKNEADINALGESVPTTSTLSECHEWELRFIERDMVSRKMIKKRKTISPPVKDTITGRELKKTGIDKSVYERAVGVKRPNVYSHRNNTKFHELPY